VHSDSEDAQVSLAARYRDTGVRLIKGDICFIKKPSMSKNIIRIIEFGGSDLKQQHLAFLNQSLSFDVLMLRCAMEAPEGNASLN
jgi:hypothetical protein